MIGFLPYIIAGIFFAAGAYVLWRFCVLPYAQGREPKGRKTGPLKPGMKSCPLCDIVMEQGERVKSHVFPGKPFKMTHIFGCPSCYPPNASHRRICPVCGKEVPRDGYVIARMFDKPGRKHVHVLGCTGCRDRGLK
jgi:hypothetical protein